MKKKESRTGISRQLIYVVSTFSNESHAVSGWTFSYYRQNDKTEKSGNFHIYWVKWARLVVVQMLCCCCFSRRAAFLRRGNWVSSKLSKFIEKRADMHFVSIGRDIWIWFLRHFMFLWRRQTIKFTPEQWEPSLDINKFTVAWRINFHSLRTAAIMSQNEDLWQGNVRQANKPSKLNLLIV